jgi:PST family polysaccharide transporter
VLLSIIRGSISWLVISNLATISSVLVTIYSGSILTTEEFGAVGLIMLVINVLESLKQLGVKEYLIATDKVENREEDIAWSIEFLKGLILFFIVCFIAKYYEISEEFHNLNSYLFILGFTFLFDSLNSPTYYKLRKFMKYKQLIAHNLMSNITQASTTIFMLFQGFTYEAVIVGYFFKSLIFNTTGYFFAGRLPRFKVEEKEVRVMFSYGGWIFVSGILYYVTSRLDNLIIAKYLTLSDLGVYTFMYAICSSLIARPSKSISNALFPILTKNKNADYVHVIIKLCFILFVVSIIFNSLIPIILDYWFGQKWEKGYYVIKILCFAMAVNAVKIDSYFMAFKKTKDKFTIELVRASFFLILLIPAVSYRGIDGAAEVTLIANLISLLVWFYLMNKRFNKNEG